MNTKITLGVGIAAVVIGAALLALTSHYAPAPSNASTAGEVATTTATSTTPASPKAGGVGAKAPDAPTITVGKAVKAFVPTAAFDMSAFAATATYPVITGTANVTKVGLIIYDSKGAGISGTSEIPVVDGHWSYSSPVALAPGHYTLLLMVGETVRKNATLTVTH